MNVVLPQKTYAQIGMEGKSEEIYPMVYLLHAMSDDHTVWRARTSIERYASETFGAGAALSGAYLHLGDFDKSYVREEMLPYWQGIFGDLDRFRDSENDLMHLAETLKPSGKPLPKLFAWCGTEDGLYSQNLQACKHVKELGYNGTTSESAGDHQWRCWEEQI